MPHKVNPIDFENAEGNLGLGHAICQHLADKLPISRMQRDLSDSTVLRNLGVGVGYTLLAIQSLQKGLGKLNLNQSKLDADLDAAWEVLGEAIQTVLRQHNVNDAYEQLKALTRGQKIDSASLSSFIDGLSIPDEHKQQLKTLMPSNYIGLANTQALAL